MYHAVRFPKCILVLSLTSGSDGDPNIRVISGRALVSPGADPRPRTTRFPRFPRSPPQEPYGPNEPSNEPRKHGNPIHHTAFGTGFHLYLLSQSDPNRGVVVPALFPKSIEGSVDFHDR